jgi:dTDP-4-dehydrorhamnose reductase
LVFQMERVLITGGGGQLASDLAERLGGRCRLEAPSRADLDITDDAAVARAFERVDPSVVFNCAAFHNVEVCERDEDRAFEVNARAVKHLAERCAAGGARFVHLSTNYVFAGDREAPYLEGDRPDPRSVYAISKLSGEYAALAYCSDALVVRGAGLYGRHGSASKGGNFVQRMLARATEQPVLRMVADQRLNPTYTADLADAVLAAVERRTTGLLHLTNAGACSWHEFTVAIMEIAGVDVAVEPVETVRSPGGADRPLNGVLSGERAQLLGVPALRPWREALEHYMVEASLSGPGPSAKNAVRAPLVGHDQH